MSKEEIDVISKNFQGWKVILAILLGLGISLFLLFRAINQHNFVEVEPGMGTYNWVDTNGDGIKDLNEYVKVAQGNYNDIDFVDSLALMTWDLKAIFFLGLALLFMVGRDVFYMIRIRILTKHKLSWNQAFYTIMLWEFASALSPGVVGGAAVAMFILKKEKIDLGRSTAIVVIATMLDNLFYVVMIPIVFLVISNKDLFPHENASTAATSLIFWGGYAIITFLCILLALSIFKFPKLITSIIIFIFRLPLLSKWKQNAIQTGLEIETASKELRKEDKVFWWRSFMSTMGSWTCRFLVINAILNAFLPLSAFENILIYGKQFVLWIFMLVSPTPGGSGVAEYAFSELLAPFSQSAILLVVLAIIWRLISYFPYLFIGAFLLPRWLRKTKTKKAN